MGYSCSNIPETKYSCLIITMWKIWGGDYSVHNHAINGKFTNVHVSQTGGTAA